MLVNCGQSMWKFLLRFHDTFPQVSYSPFFHSPLTILCSTPANAVEIYDNPLHKLARRIRLLHHYFDGILIRQTI